MTQIPELSEIQATALRHRPMPYCGAFVFMRINDGARTDTTEPFDTKHHDAG
jgi:hypothetical protein